MTGRRAYREMSAKDKGERTECRLDASGLTPAEGGKEGGKAESPSVCCVAPREGLRGPVGSPGAKIPHGSPARGLCGPWGSPAARGPCSVCSDWLGTPRRARPRCEHSGRSQSGGTSRGSFS